MSEQRPGQGNIEGSGPIVEPIIEKGFYDFVGPFLAAEDTPVSALGPDPEATRKIFSESQGNYLTPASTYRVVEQVAQGPTDLATINENTGLQPLRVTRTVNYLAQSGVVGKHKWILAITPDESRHVKESRMARRSINVAAAVHAADEISIENPDQTVYVSRDRFFERMVDIYPELHGQEQKAWDVLLPDIRRQQKPWTHGIAVTPESGRKGHLAVALTPEFQSHITALVASFEGVKRALALDMQQTPDSRQQIWDVHHAVSPVERILAIGDGEFDIKDAFWPRMIFGLGYEPRRQQVPWHSWHRY